MSEELIGGDPERIGRQATEARVALLLRAADIQTAKDAGTALTTTADDARLMVQAAVLLALIPKLLHIVKQMESKKE